MHHVAFWGAPRAECRRQPVLGVGGGRVFVFLGLARVCLKNQGFTGLFSPTAESFGVSAQTGSGVVRGGPEVRFHEGSTRVPRGFHQSSTRVPPGFHQGSTRVPPGFHQGSTRVPRGSARAAG